LAALALTTRGEVVIAGEFDAVDYLPRAGLARLSAGRATPDAPDFLDHPQSTTVSVRSATFRAFAYGHPRPALQWLADGREVPDATNPTFCACPPGIDDARRVQVRATNAQGTALSQTASILRIPVDWVALDLVGETVRVSVGNVAGRQVWLEYKEALTDPAWKRLSAGDYLAPGPGSSDDVAVLLDCPTASTMRFYRVGQDF
jgi:hypothetical protein